MITRVIQAGLAGGFAFLVCILVGALLTATGIPVVTTLGAFLERWAVAIAILFAVSAFVGGGPSFRKFW